MHTVPHLLAADAANPAGLHIRSFPQGDEVICDWKAGPNQEAYTGAVSGGILGTLLDEMERRGLSTGLATLCVGAGMGTATVIERV